MISDINNKRQKANLMAYYAPVNELKNNEKQAHNRMHDNLFWKTFACQSDLRVFVSYLNPQFHKQEKRKASLQ